MTPATPLPRRRGRPRKHPEAWTKVSIVMFDRQVERLRRLSAAIRRRSGAVLSRADIIRALLEALSDSGLDVTRVSSGDELRRLVSRKLKDGRKS